MDRVSERIRCARMQLLSSMTTGDDKQFNATEQCKSKRNRVMRKNADFLQFLVMKGKGL